MKNLILAAIVALLGLAIVYVPEKPFKNVDAASEGWVPQPMAAPPAPAQSISPPAPAAPAVPVQTWEDALKQARETGKQIFLFAGGEKCVFCDRMKAEVLPNREVKLALDKYIVIFIDVAKEPGLGRKYQITLIPTMLIVDKDERVVKSKVGYIAAADMVKWLSEQAAPQPQADPQRNFPPSQPLPQQRLFRGRTLLPGQVPGSGPVGPGNGFG